MEQDGIIFIGEHKFNYLRFIMRWCKIFKLDYDLAMLATCSVRELRAHKTNARHGWPIIDPVKRL